MSYGPRASKNTRFFGSKLSNRLIIEAVFFCLGLRVVLNLSHLDFEFMSISYPTLAHFRHFSSLLTNLRSTPVENSLQISTFYAKQSQFQIGQK